MERVGQRLGRGREVEDGDKGKERGRGEGSVIEEPNRLTHQRWRPHQG